MTDKATLLALAERVEKAEGADIRLDCLIENSLELAKFERDPRVIYGDADYNRVTPKAFTATIDAAMTLVPEGWNFANLSQSDKGGWWCELRRGHHTSYNATAFGSQLENATPAIAVCAAALRAHASQK